MSEGDRRRYDSRSILDTRFMVLEIVAGNPGVPFMELNNQVQEALLKRAEEGKPLKPAFGQGQPWRDLEQFVESMSGRKQQYLKRTGLDGTSSFELAYHGERSLALKKSKTTPQY